MLFPTISGMLAVPLKVISLTSTSTDTFTAQELADGVFGGAAIGAVGEHLRFASVAKKQVGEAGLKKIRSGMIGGVL
jgi:hypothetical protein